MKKSLLLFSSLVTLCLCALPVKAADLKIGVVDMQRVFQEYYKTKEADARLKEVLAGYQKEYQDMMADYQKSVDEATKLRSQTQDATLDAKVRDEKTKALQTKVTELQAMERKIQEFNVTRRKQLDDQSQRMRKNIVEEITKVITSLGQAGKYNILLDKSGMTLNGTPTALYVDGLSDISDDIIKTMNANAPKGGTAPAAPTTPPAKK
jgi:outer membrane protein